MVTSLVLSTFCYKADGSCEARNVSYKYSLCVCMKVKLFDQLLNTSSIKTILLDTMEECPWDGSLLDYFSCGRLDEPSMSILLIISITS